jgi:Protein of unknown function (DUF1573)
LLIIIWKSLTAQVFHSISNAYTFVPSITSNLSLTNKISLEMKQIFSILALVVFGAFAASAQTMTFEQTTMDYGTIDKGGEPLRKFTFTNTGDQPLIITDAKGSCGCTVPKWDKEPIMPGASSSIEVRYDTQRVGGFTKTVTLTSNDTAGASKTLTIKGEVKAVTVEEAVPASTGGIKQ